MEIGNMVLTNVTSGHYAKMLKVKPAKFKIGDTAWKLKSRGYGGYTIPKAYAPDADAEGVTWNRLNDHDVDFPEFSWSSRQTTDYYVKYFCEVNNLCI